MAYTYDQLVLAYKAVHDGIAPDAATQAIFQTQAVLSAYGQLTDAQLLGNIINGADSTTALAVLSYQFFTGKSPTAAGIDYLVNSATNSNDLNDPYYWKFSLENRYINFAANLGVQGEGAANFASQYGAMSFGDYVASIYQTIVGGSYAQAAGIDPAAAIASIVACKDAILATAQSAGMIPANATAAQIDLALKAATAGYLLGEAIKADVGLYAAAANNFMAALATGTAVYNTNLTYTYQPSISSFSHGTGKAVDIAPTVLPAPPPVVTPPVVTPPVTHSYLLTTGVDTFTATAQDDTFTATNTTFQAADVLDGGAGNDTLTITANTSGSGYAVPSNTHISNIETINISNTDAVAVSIPGSVTGVQKLNVTASGARSVATLVSVNAAATTTDISLTVNDATDSYISLTNGHNDTLTVNGATAGQTIAVNTPRNNAFATSGDILVTRTTTGSGAAGDITVFGGATIKVNLFATNAVNTTQTNAYVDIYGSLRTTSVEVNNPTPVAVSGSVAGIIGNKVYVEDYNTAYTTNLGTITTIKIDGFGTAAASGLTVNSLANLTLAHGSGAVSIDNQGHLAAGYATTLNATLDTVSLTTFKDSTSGSQYTTLNIATGSSASSIANLDFRAATQLNVSGSGSLTVTSLTSSTLLHSAAVTGTASLTATFGTGNDAITLGAGASVIDTGTGNDQVIVTAANAASNTIYSTLTLSAGADTLKINAQGGAAAFTGTMGATATGTVFQDYLNSAASGDGHTTSHWGWFQLGGDTYIVLDNSASATFQAGTDIVVKLVGAFNEAGATINAGVLTIQ